MRCSEGFRLDQFLVGTDVIVAQTLDLRLILLRRGLIDPGHPEACCLGGADGVEGVSNTTVSRLLDWSRRMAIS